MTLDADRAEVRARLLERMRAIEQGAEPGKERDGAPPARGEAPSSSVLPATERSFAASHAASELAGSKGTGLEGLDGARPADESGKGGASTPSDDADEEKADAGRARGLSPQDAASPEAAFRRLERWAARSEQASAPLRARLVRAGYTESAASRAVERAVRCGLVDDARFAEVLVRSRLSQGRGRQGIAAELSRAGIDPQTRGELYDYDEQEELSRALRLLDARPPGAKNLRAAAYRRLVGKGYASHIASRAARLWCEDAQRREAAG